MRNLVMVLSFVLFGAALAQAESLTLTSFYPSPSGDYQELKVLGNLGVGTGIPLSRLHVQGTQLAAFTGATRGLLTLSAPYTATRYTPIDFLYTVGANPTARIAAYHDGSGSKLVFGTSNNYGSGITNTAMVVDQNGNVGVGVASPLEKFDVRSGAIVAGINTSTTGGLILAGNYSGGNNYLNTFGSHFSSGGTVVGYAVKGQPGAGGYVSSTGIAVSRAAMNLDGDITFLTAASQTTTVDAALAMTSRMVITNAGDVGVGVSPAYKLDVNGTVINRLPTNGYLALSGDLSGYASGLYPTLKTNGACIYFDAGGVYTGNICDSTGFTDVSDETLKKNIAVVENALDKIAEIRGVTFNWKDERDLEKHMGVLAQDVEKVAPELVTQPKGIGTKGVFYGGLNALTIEAVKELDARTRGMQMSGQKDMSVSGSVSVGTTASTSKLQVVGLPAYANNAAAVAGGLSVGAFYRTGGDPDVVCVVH